MPKHVGVTADCNIVYVESAFQLVFISEHFNKRNKYFPNWYNFLAEFDTTTTAAVATAVNGKR